MTETATGTRTAEQIATEALGDRLDARNWGIEGPWAFDNAVLQAATRVRETLTSEEEERVIAHVGDSALFHNTLMALADQDFVTAGIILSMYWEMEKFGTDD